LNPFPIDDELRDGSFAHVPDHLFCGPWGGLDIDLAIGDLVFIEESFGLAAVAAPCSGINQHMHPPIIPWGRGREQQVASSAVVSHSSQSTVVRLEWGTQTSSVTLRSPLAEEFAQQFSAFFRQFAAGYRHLMVEPGVIQDLENRSDRARLGIGRGIDETA
jgi:hypothetical protein